MSSTTKLAHKLQHIASAWPVDPFRPNLQLKTFLTSLSAHPNLTSSAVEAARILHENGVQRKYPVSDKLLKPASVPLYYERLNEGYEKSAQGIKRPWWKVFFNVW